MEQNSRMEGKYVVACEEGGDDERWWRKPSRMGCLTSQMCNQISIMIGRYRWSQQEKDRKIHWISWEKNSPSQVYGWSGIPGHTCLQYVRAGKTGVEVDSEFRSLCARVGNDTTIHKNDT